jgi:HPt (histidine-containing phosphotransfer) domain-containing protein
MDMYIAKPLDKQELFRALQGCTQAEHQNVPALSSPKPLTMDVGQALERAGGDRTLLNEVCELFLQESGTLMEQLSRSVREDEPDEACRIAHRLKTSAGTIGGVRAYEAAAAMERAVQRRPDDSITLPVGRLQQEVAALRNAVADYLCAV